MYSGLLNINNVCTFKHTLRLLCNERFIINYRFIKSCQIIINELVSSTDVNGIWGLIHFIQQCRYQDIKPIAGANIITPNQEA